MNNEMQYLRNCLCTAYWLVKSTIYEFLEITFFNYLDILRMQSENIHTDTVKCDFIRCVKNGFTEHANKGFCVECK